MYSSSSLGYTMFSSLHVCPYYCMKSTYQNDSTWKLFLQHRKLSKIFVDYDNFDIQFVVVLEGKPYQLSFSVLTDCIGLHLCQTWSQYVSFLWKMNWIKTPWTIPESSTRDKQIQKVFGSPCGSSRIFLRL